ncbi:MAG TPA: gamma-glutamyltransferase [Verrucomicrobiae bacterium]|nr:gamma-glutamyltransferase [Verrucomicrobiae bacterium]
MKIIFLLFSSLSIFAAEPIRAKHGMVVSSHHLASQVGVEVMRSGGNAIDAAVATGLALAVVHPSAGNIGGGGFMVVFTKSGEVTTFDFREKAPLVAHERMFIGDGKTNHHEGYKSVGVPGTVAGFDLALKRFGTKDWNALTPAAIKLAEEGFQLSPALAKAFADLGQDWQKYPSSGKVFLHAKAGQTWKQPDLAKTLRRIQQQGRAGFYSGVTARSIAADMRKHRGLITEEDLAKYEARERKPIRGTYRAFDIYSMPPPSSGGVALVEMLNILEGYEIKSYAHNSAPYVHLLAETMRRAFADRAKHLGDPDFSPDIPIAMLTSKEHAAKLRRTIDLNHASPSDPAEFGDAYESAETTHYSVIDAEGNAVVVTYTLENSYGSRIIAEGLGFLYNNEMGDFNPEPGHTDETGTIGTPPNLVAPGKRMLSSMTPTIVAKDGKPVLLIGSPGGRTIINTVLQITLNVIDREMNIADAIAAGRFHHQWLPNQIQIERENFSDETTQSLVARRHKIVETPRIGEAMGIMIDAQTQERLGAADPRSPGGKAVGF